ncbi:glycosyltransferase family 4 protein [Patescibacteria group bacterium]
MTIAIDIRAACGKKAGKGWMVYYLVEALTQLPAAGQHKFILLTKDDPCFDFRLPQNFRISKISWPGLLWHLVVAWRVRFAKNIDVYLAPSSFIVPALTARKCVVIVHDLVSRLFPEGHNKKATLVENLFLSKALKKARRVIAISKHTKKDIAREFPFAKSKTEVVYLAGHSLAVGKNKIPEQNVETRHWRVSGSGERRASGAPLQMVPSNYLLFVSTIEPRKNVKRIIQALPQVRQHTDIDLVLVGKKGWQWQEIFSEIKRLNLQASVRYLDYVPAKNMPGLYQNAQAFVFPSLYEGFGIPVLEAMQYGCPVVTSNVSSLPEVAGDAAVLVNPRSTDAIARGIEQALGERESLRERGYKQAAKFSWENNARQTLKIIEQV